MSNGTYILAAEDISAMRAEEKTHFLNKNAIYREKSLSSPTAMEGLEFRIVEVAPGRETTEHHVHHHEEECIYVLSGFATARIGGESFPIKAGDFLGYRKGGLAHSILNTGSEPLKCIIASNNLGHDVADYPRVGKRLYRNRGLTWNMVDLTAIDRPVPRPGG